MPDELIGAPQLGQDIAWSDTSRPHSGHFDKAIVTFSPSYGSARGCGLGLCLSYVNELANGDAGRLVDNDVGMGDPFFCKYVCPQGVLEGAIPLAIANAGIRSALGQLFTWKLVVLIAVVVLSVLFYRPFCKWICPLGAFYALMNKVSLLGIRVDACKCVSCGKCSKVCQMDVDVVRAPNHAECIRCGKCIGACPVDAISYRYGLDVPAEKLPLTADKK